MSKGFSHRADDAGQLAEPLRVDERGHDDDLEVRLVRALPQVIEEGDAVHHRHVEVQEDEGRAGEPVQRHQRLGAVSRGDDRVAILDQHVLERVPEVVVVLGEEDRCVDAHHPGTIARAARGGSDGRPGGC